ncbi:unnamed protein product [Euphydryas editha]|uniref:Ketoreductase domain-containing protein n=1 Tax=Euphydryas editha TaxID=104508 RepID=A0AAU9U936_EUPED|nr:unnamed protein product [Euphydryas editha]
MSFTDKVVIITGASSGIGASAAKMFSKEGARVVIVGRNQEMLSATAAHCPSSLVVRADITVDSEAQRVIDETVKKFGKIDVLVNNAGGLPVCRDLTQDGLIQAFDSIMNLNLRSVVHLTTLAAPHLVKTKGNIVNISSVAGVVPPFGPGATNYCVAKAGLNHFTVCAAVELASHGVRVNTISPGPVSTNFQKNANYPTEYEKMAEGTLLKRVSKPEEIADLILYLASDRAIGVTGVNWFSDNGFINKR